MVFFRDRVYLETISLGVASNCNDPDLFLLSSWDYRHEPWHFTRVFFCPLVLILGGAGWDGSWRGWWDTVVVMVTGKQLRDQGLWEDRVGGRRWRTKVGKGRGLWALVAEQMQKATRAKGDGVLTLSTPKPYISGSRASSSVESSPADNSCADLSLACWLYFFLWHCRWKPASCHDKQELYPWAEPPTPVLYPFA
jgi:hypothetical protein